MKLVLALKRFVYPGNDGPMIDCTRIEVDPELLARNKAKRDAAVDLLGPAWVLHKKNSPKQQQPAANDEAANESDRTH